MGYWSARVENMAAADGVSVWENALFTPSLGIAGLYRGAPSALVVQAGEGSVAVPDGTEDLNFAPKIVRYEGMKTLPAGESWGWPLSGNRYPKLAFHAPESGYTLCFEDRDGCAGLHGRYEGNVRLWNEGRRVVLWLVIEPFEMESLSFPGERGGGFRTLFSLTIDGEEGLYRLEEVCDYDPSAPSTKCVFIKHIP